LNFKHSTIAIALGLSIVTSLGCPGDGSGGRAPLIINNSTPECIVFGSGFPSGFDILSTDGGEAAVAQFSPSAVLGLDLESEPPRLLASEAIPDLPEVPSSVPNVTRLDTDSDGLPDGEVSAALGFNDQDPRTGNLRALSRDRVLLVTSGYEQILLMNPRDGLLQFTTVATPPVSPDFDPEDWPFWPPVGVDPFRTGFSTRACVYGTGLQDSNGAAIGPEPRCDGVRDGFFTSFTADVLAGTDRIFVATSNLLRSSRAQFAPGTVLVFEYDASSSPPSVRPDLANATILTSAFNPTSLTPYTTPTGREFVLVGLTGSIALGTGPDLVRTESAIDVIDMATRELVATIPLGLAGLGFSGIAIDPSGRLGLIGAATRRALFGIDLAALDDPNLGFGPQPLPILLDGSIPGYRDARVFDAFNPFELPKRMGGPSDNICTTQTSVAIQGAGRFAAATDFCDGTISVLDLELPASRNTAIDPSSVLRLDRVIDATDPIIDTATEIRAIGRIVIRPGTAGIDFNGPDVHFTAGIPKGAVCGIRIDAL
jgi:hypothetical protein